MKVPVLISILFFILFVPMAAADDQIYWTVIEDEDVEGTGDCSGGYPLIEDYPGIWELSVEEGGEDIPISKYIVLPGEVFASVDCNHMVTLVSSPFRVDKDFSAIDLRYRDTSGLWFLIQVDSRGFNNINQPWENKDCYEESQNIVTVSNYPLPDLNDGNAHTLTVRIIDYDGYCPDASQIWIPTKIKESNKPLEKSIEESTGLGVSATRIVTSILNLANIKDLITGGSDDEDEVTVVTSAVGEIYGPIPGGAEKDELKNPTTPPSSPDLSPSSDQVSTGTGTTDTDDPRVSETDQNGILASKVEKIAENLKNGNNIYGTKYYVRNKGMTSNLAVDAFHKLKSLAYDFTIGLAIKQRGITCQDYMEKTKSPLRNVVDELYGGHPDVRLEAITFIERSTIRGEGVSDDLDAVFDDNHILYKLTLPDGSEKAIDFWDNARGETPVIRDWNETENKWKGFLGEDEFCVQQMEAIIGPEDYAPRCP